MTVTARHVADDAARKAFRRMLEHHLRTGEWSPTLVADWSNAEHVFDAMPEWYLDALHEATTAELDELADAELPDVPLAAVSESELRLLWGSR